MGTQTSTTPASNDRGAGTAAPQATGIPAPQPSPPSPGATAPTPSPAPDPATAGPYHQPAPGSDRQPASGPDQRPAPGPHPQPAPGPHPQPGPYQQPAGGPDHQPAPGPHQQPVPGHDGGPVPATAPGMPGNAGNYPPPGAVRRGQTAALRGLGGLGTAMRQAARRTIQEGPAVRSGQPRMRRLAAVTGWALAIGFGGLIVGLVALLKILVDAPAWFEPTIILVGLLGVAFTVTAFITVKHRWLPWLLLSAATATLVVGLSVTSSAH